MSKITNRDELKDYIRRRMGAPCLNTSALGSEVLDDIIDVTLDKFYQYAFDFAQTERILYVPITGNEGVVDISDVDPQPTAINSEPFGDEGTNIGSNFNILFTVENMLIHQWGINLSSPDLVSYQMMHSFLDFYRTMYGKQYRVEIHEHAHELRILPIPRHDGGMFVGVWVKNPEIELYNYSWVREYAFAKSLIQMGMTMIRYTGVALPGGGTLNGDMYLTKGEQMVEKLELELLENWSTPPSFEIA